jgi:hypothetical protein
MVTVDEKPRAVAFWMTDAPVDDDDPLRAVKLRARDLVTASEVLDQVSARADASARASRLAEAVELLADEVFDVAETWDAGLAAGLSEADLDAAGNVAYLLWQIEHLTG